MPYNLSRAAVRRHMRYLQDMKEASTTLTWPAENPAQFARKLREAMAAAQKYSEFSEFHKLKDFYRISPRTGWVEAVWLGPQAGQVATKPSRLTINEATDAYGIVGACLKFAAKANELYFPNALLKEGEKLKVYEWGRSENPRWKLIDHSDGGATMSRKHGIDPFYLWKPEEE